MGAHIGRPTWYTLLTTFTAFQAAVMKIKLGTYTGNGAASQTISGVGFQPDVVLAAGLSNGNAHLFLWTPNMDADYSINIQTAGYLVDHIKSVNSDGFVVGDGTADANRLNVSTRTYIYICIKKTT